MLRTSFAALVAIATASCGGAPHKEEFPTHKAHAQVQAWDMGSDFALRKRQIYDTVKQAGKDDATASLLLAMSMAETQTLKSSDRDQSKDGSGDSKNVSFFNFNVGFLKFINYSLDDIDRLNADDAIADAVHVALQGLDKLGEQGFLEFHRGGATAFADHQSYGCAQYCAAIASVKKTIMSIPGALTNSMRYGQFIEHV